MVKLRLKRMGSKFNAFYRVVAADERKNPTGKFIEQIGYYNPHSKELFINEELKTKWIENGAKPSDTVKGLFRKYDANKANAKDGIVTIPVKAKKAKAEASVEETTEA